jgi:hypothetical protein
MGESMKQPTTLELVLLLSNGALLVPLKKTASILGMEVQTLRNQRREGRFPLDAVGPSGTRVFFSARDIANLLENPTDSHPQKGRGRPTKLSMLAKRINV